MGRRARDRVPEARLDVLARPVSRRRCPRRSRCPSTRCVVDGDDVKVVAAVSDADTIARPARGASTGIEILRGVDLEVRSGEVHAVDGPERLRASRRSRTRSWAATTTRSPAARSRSTATSCSACRPGSARSAGCSSRCSTRSRCRACRSTTWSLRRVRGAVATPTGSRDARRRAKRSALGVRRRAPRARRQRRVLRRREEAHRDAAARGARAEVRGARRDRLRPRRRRAARRRPPRRAHDPRRRTSACSRSRTTRACSTELRPDRVHVLMAGPHRRERAAPSSPTSSRRPATRASPPSSASTSSRSRDPRSRPLRRPAGVLSSRPLRSCTMFVGREGGPLRSRSLAIVAVSQRCRCAATGRVPIRPVGKRPAGTSADDHAVTCSRAVDPSQQPRFRTYGVDELELTFTDPALGDRNVDVVAWVPRASAGLSCRVRPRVRDGSRGLLRLPFRLASRGFVVVARVRYPTRLASAFRGGGGGSRARGGSGERFRARTADEDPGVGGGGTVFDFDDQRLDVVASIDVMLGPDPPAEIRGHVATRRSADRPFRRWRHRCRGRIQQPCRRPTLGAAVIVSGRTATSGASGSPKDHRRSSHSRRRRRVCPLRAARRSTPPTRPARRFSWWLMARATSTCWSTGSREWRSAS